MDIKRNCCALLLMAVFFFSGMGLLSANQFSRMERIGTEKDVTVADKMRAKAMGPNVCVQRIPIGFQTSCVIINFRHNCTMTSHYRSVFHCCPGFTAVLKKSGCPHELYVTNMTLIQELQKMGLSTLVMLIKSAGLIKTLSGKAKFTVLAPSEDAFKKLSKKTLKKLMNDKKALTKVLLYHVIRGKVPCSALEDNQKVATMDGKNKIRVNLFFNDRFVTVNGVPVRVANKGASNGIIHVIDSVLVHPTLVGEKVLAGINRVSLFQKALAMNNISITEGQTIFAPSNKAFNEIDPSIFGRLLRSPKCLKNLLLNHILPNPVYTTILNDKESFGVRTKEGTAYFMKKSNGTTTIGKAKILMSDTVAKDSVIHVIDEVLMPTSALTVLEIARNRGAHIFYKIIKKRGLRSLIKESEKYTIFAPTDDAMNKFIANATESVLSNITDIIKYHIVPRSVQTCDFENDMLLNTLDGKNKIRINVYDYGLKNAVQGVCLGSSKCNLEACNGAVHIISEVLTPATQTLDDIISTDKRFTAFAAALEKAQLDSLLKGEGPLTIFAPTNTAFSKVKPTELEELLADVQRLKGLIKYHIVRGTYFRCAFSRECPLVSVNGRSVLVRISKNFINVNGAKSSGKEITATNGVIYPIDCVLSPNYRQSLFSQFWQLFSF